MVVRSYGREPPERLRVERVVRGEHSLELSDLPAVVEGATVAVGEEATCRDDDRLRRACVPELDEALRGMRVDLEEPGRDAHALDPGAARGDELLHPERHQ